MSRKGEGATPYTGVLAPGITLHLLTAGMIVLGILTWNVWSDYRGFRTARAQNARLDDMVKQINEVDQFLTTFARLGTSFASTRWEGHYWESALRREKMMSRMRKLSAKVFAGPEALEMNTAKAELTDRETKALAFVRDNKPDLADPMVFGDAYEQSKAIYAKNFKKLTEDLRDSLAYHLTARRQKAAAAVICGALLLPVFIVLHFVFLNSLNRYYAKRDEAASKA